MLHTNATPSVRYAISLCNGLSKPKEKSDSHGKCSDLRIFSEINTLKGHSDSRNIYYKMYQHDLWGDFSYTIGKIKSLTKALNKESI